MKLVKDYLQLDIDLKGHLKKNFQVGDKEVELFLDNVFNSYEGEVVPADVRNLIHKGIVIGKPRGLSNFVKKDDITLDEVEVGDVLYLHHRAIDFERRHKETGTFFMRLWRDMITKYVTGAYCKVTPEGEVIPIHKWSICKKFKTVFETTTIIIPEHLRKQKREDLLEVITPSRFIKDEVSPGDIIVVNKNGIYEINVEGEDYVFIHTDDLYGIKLD